MQNRVSVKSLVNRYYWQDDFNCATTCLKILAEIFSVELSDQIISAAVGMHGAGKYGAQCGLVEGALMFLGIIGKEKQIPEEVIVDQCRKFAERFERQFGSLSCRELRPEGFTEENPPHLCENLTCDAVTFNRTVVAEFLEGNR